MQTDLADNMGTSLAMLQRSYFHFDARAAADRLSGETKSERSSTDKSLPRKKLLSSSPGNRLHGKTVSKRRRTWAKKLKPEWTLESSVRLLSL
jgi:hypothetical protein